MKTLFFALACLFAACSTPSSSSQEKTILASLSPYADFVEKVAQGKVKVVLLVPPGANPHIYEPSPRQVEEISKAAIWLQSGDPSEAKILTVLKEQNPSLATVNLSAGFALLNSAEHACEGEHDHDHEESKDLHVWLDPKIAQKQVAVIAKILGDAFPELKEEFMQNAARYTQELQKVDSEIAAELSPFQGDAILVSHPAFAYFCAAYGLKQLSIECEGKDPLPQDISQTLQEAKEARVRAVFTQAQYNNKGAVLIAEKLDLPVYDVDPYARNYLENIRHLANLIAHAH